MLGGKIYEKDLNVGIDRNSKKQTELFNLFRGKSNRPGEKLNANETQRR